MVMSKVTTKGQATIPKEIRELLGLKPGDRVMFLKRGDEIVLYPVKGTLLD
ncbi:AbrB/MazE/SpoVT family DNA-binding domain-containing protein, partial [Candidatus Bipolaricaulota bacterium]|nr:AbrB/MazE/SpoVT family DNA-binding domain-containing protein [Candidatus Bipolaricaulota bacterium]